MLGFVEDCSGRMGPSHLDYAQIWAIQRLVQSVELHEVAANVVRVHRSMQQQRLESRAGAVWHTLANGWSRQPQQLPTQQSTTKLVGCRRKPAGRRRPYF